jgi:lipopolysaccharide/colanic/teichoic acid biosynthesis glycosyltransferase
MCEKPAKYTRHAPRIDAQTAAVRRWVRVVVVLAVLAVLWPVLLMIDMALPSGLSAGE